MALRKWAAALSTRRLIVLLVGALLVASGGTWWLKARAAGPRSALDALIANGTIRADIVDVGSQRQARLLRYEVEEGQEVRAGQIIARLEATELLAQVLEAEGGYVVAQNRLRELLDGTREEEIAAAEGEAREAEAAVAGARALLRTAGDDFRKRTALRQEENLAVTHLAETEEAVRGAEAALRGSEAALRIAEREYETSLQLRTARDDAARQAEAAEAGAAAAAAALQRLRNGSRDEAIQASEARVRQLLSRTEAARASYREARSDLQRTRLLVRDGALPIRQLEVAEARATVDDQKVHTLEGALEEAQAQLREVRAGPRPEEVVEAEAVQRRAQALLRGARLVAENSQRAYELRLDAEARLKSAQSQAQAASAGLAAAQARAAGARRSATNARMIRGDALEQRSRVEAAAQQVRMREGRLQAARAMLRLKRKGATSAQVAQARGEVERARGVRELARIRHEQTIVRAPVDGVITEQISRAGEVVSPQSVLVRLIPRGATYLYVYAPVRYLGRVRRGQSATVTTESRPGRSYRARIERIYETAEFTPRNVQTQDEREKLVFRVKVAPDDPAGELKPGVPADARIPLQ